MKKFYVLLIAFVCCIKLAAQNSLTGNVIDKDSKQPIEFASIMLLHLPDSNIVIETATDKKGRFLIENVSAGNYILRCSFIGYEKMETSLFTVDDNNLKQSLAAIELINKSKTLSDVTIVGKRSMLNTGIDRKIYNVEQDVMSRSGSASDILKNIPSVEVDLEGNVALRGSADVMILINGKPSPLMGRSRAEVLQQLPANSIERIEVITNPSARYRPVAHQASSIL